MKPFNLQEYLANPSRKVVTRGGSPAMIICTNDEGDTPITGFINMYGEEIQFKANKNGMYKHDGFIKQLFFDTDTKE